MALGFGGMTSPAPPPPDHPGVEIRTARGRRGWSQPELARRSGIAVRTIRRVEAGTGRHDSRTLDRLRETLGLPTPGQPGPPVPPVDPQALLRSLSAADFIAALAERLLEAEQIKQMWRAVQIGDLPPDILDKPGILRSPDGDTEHN